MLSRLRRAFAQALRSSRQQRSEPTTGLTLRLPPSPQRGTEGDAPSRLILSASPPYALTDQQVPAQILIGSVRTRRHSDVRVKWVRVVSAWLCCALCRTRPFRSAVKPVESTAGSHLSVQVCGGRRPYLNNNRRVAYQLFESVRCRYLLYSYRTENRRSSSECA